MKNKGNIGTTFVVIILSAFIFVFGGAGFTKREPNTYYAVYVDGKKIGMVDSAIKFDDYINIQEEKLKEKYGVDTIYTPKGVEVKKLITYDNSVDSYDDIFLLYPPFSSSFSFCCCLLELYHAAVLWSKIFSSWQ